MREIESTTVGTTSFARWKDLALRTWKEVSEDNIALVASGVAFYAFLALIPLLGATVLTYGLVASPETVLKNVRSLTTVMPAEAATLIGQQLKSVVATSGGKKGVGLAIALAIALFGARNAAGSVITALNIAYEEKETRSFVRVNLLALAVTVAAIILAILATFAVAALGHLETLLPSLPGVFLIAGKLASYLLLLGGAAAGAATLYRYGPNRRDARWVWITPGSILASLGWILLTLGFGFYAAHFGNYGKTYGSLATVIVLLTWVYLSAYMLLVGAELNSELEQDKAGAEPATPPAAAKVANHPVQTALPAPAPPRAPVEKDHLYLPARIAARIAPMIGGAKVGMLSSALTTVGLSMLRRKGRARIGAGLLAGAATLAWLRRHDEKA